MNKIVLSAVAIVLLQAAPLPLIAQQDGAQSQPQTQTDSNMKHDDAMRHDAMSNDTKAQKKADKKNAKMQKDSMKKDNMSHDAMKKDDAMKHDHTTSSAPPQTPQ